jgi:membrane protein DedA with SNARE-associated domain
MDSFVHLIREALVRWGYLALAIGLLGESAGLPLPGETILMLASFVSYKTTQLSIVPLIFVGTSAAVIGDNLGFYIGRKLGPRLLKWLKRRFHLDEEIAVASDQLQRHGAATIFWARYIFGLRTIAGPVAGALGMDWKRFLLYNVLGAATWVTAIALAGFFFGAKFHSLFDYIEKASWAVSGGLVLIGYIIWRREKKHYQETVEHRA